MQLEFCKNSFNANSTFSIPFKLKDFKLERGKVVDDDVVAADVIFPLVLILVVCCNSLPLVLNKTNLSLRVGNNGREIGTIENPQRFRDGKNIVAVNMSVSISDTCSKASKS
ncbi:hypothetical protein QQP08_004446 [Theobroma cacao]|nr:hypothetical protein QQP08_004446 [Theobroma cacao]